MKIVTRNNNANDESYIFGLFLGHDGERFSGKWRWYLKHVQVNTQSLNMMM
jgi:hypothetical protein